MSRRGGHVGRHGHRRAVAVQAVHAAVHAAVSAAAALPDAVQLLHSQLPGAWHLEDVLNDALEDVLDNVLKDVLNDTLDDVLENVFEDVLEDGKAQRDSIRRQTLHYKGTAYDITKYQTFLTKYGIVCPFKRTFVNSRGTAYHIL